MSDVWEFVRKYTWFCCSSILAVFIPQVGNVGERPPGPWVADAAGEEAPLDAASCQLQALPDNGNQPQGKPHYTKLWAALLKTRLWIISYLVPLCALIFLPGASESASCWTHLCVWASSWCQGQHAPDLQQHSCGSYVQGDVIDVTKPTYNHYHQYRLHSSN